MEPDIVSLILGEVSQEEHAVGCLAWRLVAMQGLARHQACHARPLHGSQAQMLMLLELLLELLLLLLLYVLIT